MDFRIPIETRQAIADYFLSKNNPDFNCSTKYDETKEVKQNIFILLADDASDAEVIESAVHRKLKYIVQNSYWSMREKVSTLYGLAENPKIFLEKEFNVLADAKMKYEFPFHIKTPSAQLAKDIFLKIGLDINSSRSIPARQTIDEFVMNAQYNAPANATNLANPKNIPDSLIIIEKNEKLLAISVIDHYGSLNILNFIKKIENSLKAGAGQSINYGHGGAGLGGTLIYNHCDTLLVGCDEFKKTRVTSVLPLNLNQDKLNYIQKSICIID